MITELKQESLTSQDQDVIDGLFKQLIADRKARKVNDVLDKNNPVVLLAYRENQRIVGMASMAVYEVLSGYKGWIEDVVVEETMRGKGVGKNLIQAMIEKGRQMGLTEIYLFTEDERTAAIQLYRHLGFTLKDSRLYHLKM